MSYGRCALVASLLLISTPAQAEFNLNVGELTADGLTVLDMSCSLDEGGLMAGAVVTGALAKQRAALDACGPQGAATRVSFSWEGNATKDIKVIAASDAKAGACVAKALGGVKAAMRGKCAVTILSGPADKAKAAALKVDEAPAQAAHPYLDPAAWTVLSHEEQGWTVWALKDSKPIDITVKVGEQTWRGAAFEHKQQLGWVMWHPTTRLTPAIVADLSAQAYRYSPDLKWIEVPVSAGDAGFKRITIHKAQHEDRALLRVAGEGARGSYVFIGLFSLNMPVEVLQLWIKSIRLSQEAP